MELVGTENLANINRKLIELPSLKARAFQLYGEAKLNEDRIKGQIFLEKRAGNTIPETNALVETDERMLEARNHRIQYEAEFKRLSDELSSYMELARNERVLMREIEPSV